MDEIHITAKWARRMLRPLTSLHHRLGKYRELQSLNAQEQEDTNTRSAAASISRNSNKNADCDAEIDSECVDNDPSWIPRRLDAKRVKHKYVARGQRLRSQPRARLVARSPESVKPLPGAIEIATPLITGKSVDATSTSIRGSQPRYGNDTNPVRFSSGHEGWSEKTSRRQKQARFPKPDPQWRVSLDSAKDINYVDIVQRLDTLFLKFLEKTRVVDSGRPRTNSVSRSLLMTVMRQLPEFIAEEQRIQDEIDNDNDVDMTDAYFTELESAYGSSGKGWPPLREGVRSQGIFLVCDMLQENWITHLTASTLVNKCIDAGENDAVEQLLGVLLSKLDYYDFPDAFDPWRIHQSIRDPVRLLHKYWAVSGNNSYTFREIERLLLRRVLPVEWMVTTPWKACVVSATKSLSNADNEYAAATKMITAILETAIDTHSDRIQFGSRNEQSSTVAKQRHFRRSSVEVLKPNWGPCPTYVHDALSNLLSSLIVALCSMYCVRMEQPVDPDLCSSARIMSIFSGLALTLQRELSIRLGSIDGEPTRVYLLRRGFILLGHYILICWQDTVSMNFAETRVGDAALSVACEPFFRLLEQKSEIIKDLSAMVGQVVRCCERDGEQAKCRRARKLCAHLLAIEKSGINNLTLFLGKVAVEVALEFAQYSQDAEDHAFAADVQERVSEMKKHLGSRDTRGRKPRDCNTLSFRWEEGIGEWIAKTPLVRTKAAASRVVSRPLVVQKPRGRSFSSISEASRSSSLDSSSSRTSLSTPSSTGLKRRSMVNETFYRNVKRPRREYTTRRPEEVRESRITERRHSNVSVVIHKKRQSHRGACDYESDDIDVSKNASGSEEWSGLVAFPTRTGVISSHGAGTRAPVESQISAVQKVKRANFEVIIHNCARANQPSKRGRGRPRKHVAQLAPSQTTAPLQPHSDQSQRRLVIPCSEGEESDDELSFL